MGDRNILTEYLNSLDAKPDQINETIGTCGNCGGAVVVSRSFDRRLSGTPTCSTCFATPLHRFGPVIKMTKDKN